MYLYMHMQKNVYVYKYIHIYNLPGIHGVLMGNSTCQDFDGWTLANTPHGIRQANPMLNQMLGITVQ